MNSGDSRSEIRIIDDLILEINNYRNEILRQQASATVLTPITLKKRFFVELLIIDGTDNKRAYLIYRMLLHPQQGRATWGRTWKDRGGLS